MHWIQKQILQKLIFNPSLRYAQLKPAEVEGNLFMYHLRCLIREKLVTKTEKGYALSAEGKRYADKLSLKTLKPRVQPKIVTMIACQNKAGEWLLYRRRRQPFTGQIGFPHGKIHLGEAVTEAATRELDEKAGLKAQLRHRGEVYLTVYEGDELVTQTLCHVFQATRPIGALKGDGKPGSCFWQKVERPASGEYAPGFADIYKLLSRPTTKRFFEEYSHRIRAN